MAIIQRQTVWLDNQILGAPQLDGEFDNILNDYNGGITNANIAAGAGIEEAKLTFSASGHGHTGGSDGKVIAITKTVSYGGFISGGQPAGNDLSINPRARAATTVTRFSVHAKTAPTGADAIFRCYNISQSLAVATVTLTAGNQDVTTTTISNASITSGDKLRFDITQQGSSVLASDITCQLDGTE